MKISALALLSGTVCAVLAGCAAPGTVAGGNPTAYQIVADNWNDLYDRNETASGLFFTVKHTDKWRVVDVWDRQPENINYRDGEVLFFYNYRNNRAHPVYQYGTGAGWDIFYCETNRKTPPASACLSPLAEKSTLATLGLRGNGIYDRLAYRFDKDRVVAVLQDIGTDQLREMVKAGRIRKYDEDYPYALKDSSAAREYIADYARMDFKNRIPALKAGLQGLIDKENSKWWHDMQGENAAYARDEAAAGMRNSSMVPAQDDSQSNSDDRFPYRDSMGLPTPFRLDPATGRDNTPGAYNAEPY